MGGFKKNSIRLVVIFVLFFIWYLNRKDRKECFDYTMEIVSSKQFTEEREKNGFWPLPYKFIKASPWKNVKEFRLAPDSLKSITLGPCLGAGEYDIIIISDSVRLVHIWNYHWGKQIFMVQHSKDGFEESFQEIEITQVQYERFLSNRTAVIKYLDIREK